MATFLLSSSRDKTAEAAGQGVAALGRGVAKTERGILGIIGVVRAKTGDRTGRDMIG